jgi:hypothetical protein
MFSGCADNDCSADAVVNGKAGGAMSTSFIHVMTTSETPEKTTFLQV